ncbi:MAG TPA: DNA polymerase III subunit alpha, partial [Firmicutes bacterium]|nr:DNA polymerase III subunit alpha [Bacillota bacterium]
MPGFVHLHNHSEYSLLDAIARCPEIAARCKELGFDSYALTDHGVMYGALEFYLAMRELGLKPILGCEFYIAARRLTDKDPNLDRRNRHLVLLARDTEGYRNLMKLTSIAHTDGFYYKPRVDLEAVAEHKAGLVALTACPGGVVAAPYHHEGEEQAYAALETYLKVFGAENLFLEIQYHYLEMEDRYRQWARDAANRAGVRLVATNDCHYVHKEDARAHDIALCLRDKKLLTDADRQKYSGPEYYIKSEGEMRELHADYQDALDNTLQVAALCNLELDLDEVHFPNLTLPAEELARLRSWQIPAQAKAARASVAIRGQSESGDGIKVVPGNHEQHQQFSDYLRMLTYQGAARRYGEVTPELSERIEYELSVIIDKGFSTYFLICAEFCNWARQQDIPVGPGRGSAAGSVVAYSLEITDLDPIKYGLYFERFLNPERIELPDFDIDFCKRRRDEVIDHVKEKYGADKVALIITYSRLKARAVIKAVGRTKGLEFQYVNRVTNEIHGLNPTIDDAISNSAELQQMIAADQEIRELVEDARKLEGIAAHHSVHAAGLVISPEELPSFVPVQKHKDTNMLVTQYSMDTVPFTGLVKFDFLGLRNLTLIQDTADYIAEFEGQPIDPRVLPDGDQRTYAALQRGDGYGVFQFEAPQVKRMLMEGRPVRGVDRCQVDDVFRPALHQHPLDLRRLELKHA